MSELSTVVGVSGRPVTRFDGVSFLSEKYTKPGLFHGDFLSSRLKAKVNSLAIGEVCVEATRFATLAPDIAAGNEITAEFVDLTDVLGKTRQRSRTQVVWSTCSKLSITRP